MSISDTLTKQAVALTKEDVADKCTIDSLNSLLLPELSGTAIESIHNTCEAVDFCYTTKTNKYILEDAITALKGSLLVDEDSVTYLEQAESYSKYVIIQDIDALPLK